MYGPRKKEAGSTGNSEGTISCTDLVTAINDVCLTAANGEIGTNTNVPVNSESVPGAQVELVGDESKRTSKVENRPDVSAARRVPAIPLQLHFDRISWKRLVVCWKLAPKTTSRRQDDNEPRMLKIQLSDMTDPHPANSPSNKWTFLLPDRVQSVSRFQIPFDLTSGHVYEVTGEIGDQVRLPRDQVRLPRDQVRLPRDQVRLPRDQVIDHNDQELTTAVTCWQTLSECSLQHRAIYNHKEISTLLSKASSFVDADKSSSGFTVCYCFYRDQTFEYFDDVLENHDGFLPRRVKGNTGDPASSIAFQLHGALFSASMSRSTGLPPELSIYGPLRLCIDADWMTRIGTNLYFADFYCLQSTKSGLQQTKTTFQHAGTSGVQQRNVPSHHVLLVITEYQSAEDQFCAKNLVRLDVFRNPFLHRISGLGVLVTSSVWVDVLYTGTVRVTREQIRPVEYNGGGFSGCIPKTRTCEICNL